MNIKHNHFAVKHSRLAKNLDFAQKWFGLPCSNKYWENVKPVFEYLETQKDAGKKWRNLPNKDADVYVPLLKSFMQKIRDRFEDFSDNYFDGDCVGVYDYADSYEKLFREECR